MSTISPRIMLLCALALLAVSGCGKRGGGAELPTAQTNDETTRAKGFRWAPDYYRATNGTQLPKALVSGADARFLSNDLVLVTNPRIESFRPDGSLDWVATSVDALINRETQTASGTNVISFRTADTNLFLTGLGFLWQHSNNVLILSNRTYTWINRSKMTNSPSK